MKIISLKCVFNKFIFNRFIISRCWLVLTQSVAKIVSSHQNPLKCTICRGFSNSNWVIRFLAIWGNCFRLLTALFEWMFRTIDKRTINNTLREFRVPQCNGNNVKWITKVSIWCILVLEAVPLRVFHVKCRSKIISWKNELNIIEKSKSIETSPKDESHLICACRWGEYRFSF